MNWKSDSRGSFLEVFKYPGEGQISVINIMPGQTRGNHYHARKREDFVVINGMATINIRNRGDKEVKSHSVNGQFPTKVRTLPNQVHNIVAGPTGCVALLWCSEHYSDKDPDTFSEVV